MTPGKRNPEHFPNVGEVTRIAYVNKTDRYDWLVFPEAAIVDLQVRKPDNAQEGTVTYGTVAVANAGTAYTATTTAIAYDTGGTNQSRAPGNFYVSTASGEIMYVIKDVLTTPDDYTAGTLHVIRGCLGTTASATGVANTNTLNVMNVLKLGEDSTGWRMITYKEITQEYNAFLFKNVESDRIQR